MPPMGYYKDKLKDEIVIMDEPAEIVREIYTMYLDGFGFKAIAEKLNKDDKKSPSYYQKLYYNKMQRLLHIPQSSGKGLGCFRV